MPAGGSIAAFSGKHVARLTATGRCPGGARSAPTRRAARSGREGAELHGRGLGHGGSWVREEPATTRREAGTSSVEAYTRASDLEIVLSIPAFTTDPVDCRNSSRAGRQRAVSGETRPRMRGSGSAARSPGRASQACSFPPDARACRSRAQARRRRPQRLPQRGLLLLEHARERCLPCALRISPRMRRACRGHVDLVPHRASRFRYPPRRPPVLALPMPATRDTLVQIDRDALLRYARPRSRGGAAHRERLPAT